MRKRLIFFLQLLESPCPHQDILQVGVKCEEKHLGFLRRPQMIDEEHWYPDTRVADFEDPDPAKKKQMSHITNQTLLNLVFYFYCNPWDA